MGRYDKMTNEDFDRILLELVGEEEPVSLLQVPGVYEAVSEHFNNEVLERWERENPEEEDTEEEE